MQLIKSLTKTPTWLTVILGFSLLLLQFFQENLSQNTQIFVFIFLILLTGIPHGALDHLIQEASDRKRNRVYNSAQFSIKYLSIMAIYGLLWYWFSGISLLIFLIISAWHFGETDLEKAPKNALIWSLTRLIYGLFILAFILLTHAKESSPNIEIMLKNQSSALVSWQFICLNYKQTLSFLGIFLLIIFIVAQSWHFVYFDKIRFFRLSLILLISFWLPLLPAFALYFGGWHALCAFDAIHKYLRKDHPALSFKSVYLNSLPFTIIAILFLVGILWFSKNYTFQFNPSAILFIFISMITLPHLIIAHEMNHDMIA
jgi:beta-carotene 15,15'-dioxygenase